LLEGISLHGGAKASLVYERPFALSTFDPEVMARAAAGISTQDNTENPEQSERSVRIGHRMLGAVGFWTRDKELMLETFRTAIALAEQETPDSLVKIEKLFEDVSIQARRFPPRIVSAMMLPSVQKVPAKFASYEARRAAASTAVAIERFRLKHGGQIPESLERITPTDLPAVPSDPFDGHSLRFHKLERGYVVYSIGNDRVDNGGKERVRGSVKNTDITFIVER